MFKIISLKAILLAGSFGLSLWIGVMTSGPGTILNTEDRQPVSSHSETSKQELPKDVDSNSTESPSIETTGNTKQEIDGSETEKHKGSPYATEKLQETWSHSKVVKAGMKCKSCHKVEWDATWDVSPHHLKLVQQPQKDQQNGVDTAFLGIHAGNLLPALRSQLQIPSKQGAVVNEVVEESPAYHCGMEKHDIVLSINHEPIEGELGLRNAIRSNAPGTKILVEYIRQGRKSRCNVVLGKQRTARILNSLQIRGCAAPLNASINCQDCHASVN